MSASTHDSPCRHCYGTGVVPAQTQGAFAPKGTVAHAAAPAHARDLVLAPGRPVEVHMGTGKRSPLS